jgi:hypothetical protein
MYSVGADRRDDAGRFATREMLMRQSPGMRAPLADIGIRIAQR